MNKLKGNPLFQIAKCEMCPNRVTNFVTGLCGRCTYIWVNNRHLNRNTVSPYQVMAATVSLARCVQDSQPMHPTFKKAIEKIRTLRSQKVELFQKLRRQFLDSVLIMPTHEQPPPPAVEDDDYWNVPEIFDRDFIKFQNQIDLLEGINVTPPADSDLNNNKLPEK